MRRTIPLLITAAGGFVLVVAHFSPYTQTWGEATTIWFDVLAAIAFILGGGNLLKTHLKKVSDQGAGWAYSVITLLAFVVTLFIGLSKWGVPPADKQEYYGQTFTPLAVADFPQTYRVEGTIPERPDGQRLPKSVVRQLSQGTEVKGIHGKGEGEGEEGEQGKKWLVFRGWMSDNQKKDLKKYKNTLQWHCKVEKLAKKAKPPEDLQDKIDYHADHQSLGFKGCMSKEDKAALLKLGDEDAWKAAVANLFEKTQMKTEVTAPFVPEGFSEEMAKDVSKAVSFDAETKTLGIQGALSVEHRDALARTPFLVAKPLSDEARMALIAEVNAIDPSANLTDEQIKQFNTVLSTGWTVDQLRDELDRAGEAQEVDKKACEMLAEQKAGINPIEPKKKEGEDQKLSDEQVALLSRFVQSADWSAKRLGEELGKVHYSDEREAEGKALWEGLTEPQMQAFREATAEDDWTIDGLLKQLDSAGAEDAATAMTAEQRDRLKTFLEGLDEGQLTAAKKFLAEDDWELEKLAAALRAAHFNDNQSETLKKFLDGSPTEAERKHDLCLALMQTGPVNEQQRDFLLADYRNEVQWKRCVGELFVAAHKVKYPWSGEYNTRGTAFWLLYEYAFKPLTATMFAMLAFYVASAAFRAFRAKNVEATLLLITAFVILLGRTYAGTVATGWLPEPLAGLRLENLTVTIMKVFNTAGTRAIMIGIALGIASTSLKVLLGIDRSYLGSGED